MIDNVLAEIERDATPDAGAQFVQLAADYLAENGGGRVPVWPAASAEELAARFAGPLPSGGSTLAQVIARLREDVMPTAIRLSHPMYMGHQVSAPLPVAVWAEVLTSVLNNSLAVREMSPGGTALESTLVRRLAELAGFGARAGGTFTSGGTEATFTALLAARAAVLPDAWEKGLGDDPPVIVCGEHAHYAVTRAAGELGLGTSRAIGVASRDWRMDVDALATTLDRLDAEGRRVMAVVATAGSTPTGSFDDLDTIGRICEERGLWLHVDAAHGASALLSARHRHRLSGLERARSIAWDPHKMMLVPLSAGMVLVRDQHDLEAAFAQRAPYLFHGADAAVDQGVRSFQCSRRFDALKVWVALERHGAAGIGALYDRLCDVTSALCAAIERRPEFEALHAPEANILCFRYVGDGTLGDLQLDALNRELRERYNRSGAGWVTTTVLAGRRVLRVTMMNPRSTPAHAGALLDGLASEAARLQS